MTTYFHGSSHLIDATLPGSTCIAKEMFYALSYAVRRSPGSGFIYVFELDAASDVEIKRDANGDFDDYTLARETTFTERIPVTAEVIEKCKTEERAYFLKHSGVSPQDL